MPPTFNSNGFNYKLFHVFVSPNQRRTAMFLGSTPSGSSVPKTTRNREYILYNQCSEGSILVEYACYHSIFPDCFRGPCRRSLLNHANQCWHISRPSFLRLFSRRRPLVRLFTLQKHLPHRHTILETTPQLID